MKPNVWLDNVWLENVVNLRLMVKFYVALSNMLQLESVSDSLGY